MHTPFITNLSERQAVYHRFWQGESIGRPLVNLCAVREQPLPHEPAPSAPQNPEDRWLDPNYVIAAGLAQMAHTLYLGDSIPYLNVDLGPGSLAAYLGSRVECADQTVWFHAVLDALDGDVPIFDADNVWWRRHLMLIRRAAEAGRKHGFYAAIPDLIEGVDILASLRGSQQLVLELMLNPRDVHRHLRALNDLYFQYYDIIQAEVADADGWCITTYLEPFGQGRCGKLQCDFAALMNPKLFREFALPYLQEQASRLDYVAYHLDGPGAIYSAPLVAQIDNLRVVQWVPGAGQPIEFDACWDARVFDVLIGAGKVVQLECYAGGGNPSTQEEHARAMLQGFNRLFDKYGAEHFWIIFRPGFSEALAYQVLCPALDHWGVPLNSE